MKSKAQNENNILFVYFPKAVNPHLQEKIKMIRKKTNLDRNNQLNTQKLKKEEEKKTFNSNTEVKCSFMFHCKSCSNNNILLRIKSEIQAFLSHRKICVLIEHLFEIKILKYWANYPTQKKKS